MRFVDRNFTLAATAVLIATFAPWSPYAVHNVIAIAAAAEKGASQGVSGRPQNGGSIAGSPRANPTINGSRIRGKH